MSAQASQKQYALLRSRLIAGDFPPGSLLQETAIAAETGVSRTPVRDALSRLEQDGFLQRAPRGYRVRERTPEDVIDLYAVRIALEGLAAETAAERRTVFDIHNLTRICAEAEETDDPGRFTELSGAFHEQIAVASHNEMLKETIARMQGLMALYGRHGAQQPASREVVNDEHRSLLRAIDDHDMRSAREIAVEHLLRVRDVRIVSMSHGS